MSLLLLFGGAPTGQPKVKAGGTFAAKPLKVKSAGAFATKPLKFKASGTWTQA